MPEESHLEEMSAAIRAQRERQAVPRTMISSEDARPPQTAAAEPAGEAPTPAAQPAASPGPEPAASPGPEPAAPAAPRRRLLARLLRR